MLLLSHCGRSQSSLLFEKAVFYYNSDTLPYRLMRPKDTIRRLPLVLCLHGAGERGRDNELNLKHVTALFTDSANRADFPCYVVVPQCWPGARWVDVDWRAERHTFPSQPSRPMAAVMALLDKLISELPIDTERIYVTGLSMGGYGTWDILCRRPELFAAGVPVCGGGDENMASVLQNIPIWVFHGALDKVVKVSRSRNMVAALQKINAPVRYTEYPDIEHDSWKEAYRSRQLIEWLFAQRKKR